MKRYFFAKPERELPPRLNLGCGRRFHSAWTNIDLESSDPGVIEHDITCGLPFAANQFEAVYHSHVLEHLTPEQGRELLGECLRVLRPGGVLRIAVPDLESIARLYLATHQQACSGQPDAMVDYHWTKLELIDQMVREHSGGRMGAYMANRGIENLEFVRSRVGDEFSICQGVVDQVVRPTRLQRIAQWTFNFRKRMARRLVRWTLGRRAEQALVEGLFRNSGEVHRWMYDRFSLQTLCDDLGFEDFRVCQAEESKIADYETFELDAVGGSVRKPDSIFIECQKPLNAVSVPPGVTGSRELGRNREPIELHDASKVA